ncbi:MAG: hypothetical protein K2X28_04975 [Alphaproteobacteria bacterium]|nr:hypothetical protein [Alphaproteobacteria bacterium]
MNKLLKTTLISLGITLVLFASFGIYMYVDRYPTNKMRTMQDEVQTSEKVNLEGLKALNASGSNAPLFSQLQQRLNSVKEKKLIFDVKGSTSTYLNGIPHRYFGYHYEQPELRHYLRRLLYSGTLKAHPEWLRNEEAEAKIYGFAYISAPIGSRYISSAEDVDRFVTILESLPPGTWVHFHCERGNGRTSLALAMFDIMKNAPQVALEDIIKRQHLLGSEDLFDVVPWARGSYSLEMLTNRKKFIEDFYAFICQRKAGGQQTWSAWKSES